MAEVTDTVLDNQSGNLEGVIVNPADGKLGFYGTDTPIVKATVTLTAGTTTTLLKADVLAIATALGNLNLITVA